MTWLRSTERVALGECPRQPGEHREVGTFRQALQVAEA